MECFIRPATSKDCEVLMSFIKEIAEYHNLLHEVSINAEDLRADGFGQDPFFKCLMAELPPENSSKPGRPIGYALYYKGYCVNHGKIVYLENVYVVPEFRDKGIGKQLLVKLAEVALAAGCTGMKFSTMESNQRAKRLYLRLGAQDTTESLAWHCMEFNKEGLQRLVQGGRAS
ncbi:thialysine N-epsilon-acetyltransferase-like [Ahaetulla prasina]|uniref:thialysine N-epsilon-acetyltransferase-like n=1 Tax=Ahaetulla prasina TaxID=499056 RepID=UPI0026487BC3|nr:thialysine N-epsilon-acetyltransferase-like [Ahaetulla prasina]